MLRTYPLNFISFVLCAGLLISCKSARPTAPASQLTDSTDGASDDAQNHIFSKGIPEISIHLHGETWRKMVTHKDAGGYACDDNAPYGHVKEFSFINKATGAKVVLNNIGLRVKGNTSCDDPPENKGFKLSFKPLDKKIKNSDGDTVETIQNIYEEWGKSLQYPNDLQDKIKKQTLFGLKSLGLRRGSVDQTNLRDTISSHVIGYGGHLSRKKNHDGAPKFGGNVFRSTVAWVRIHDGFNTIVEGHYGLAELPGEDFIADRYGKDAVKHLYKIKDAKGTFLESDMPNDHGRLLSWYEPDLVDGDEYEGDREYNVQHKLCRSGKIKQSVCDKLKKQRDKAAEVILGFRKILDDLSKLPDRNERRNRLREFLDIENILSYMASVNLTGHWDSLIGTTSNNDFLYFNGVTKKWGVIVWDLDNSFGAGQQDYPWMAGIKDFGVDLKYRPMFRAVLDNFYDEYRARLGEFIGGVYDLDAINQKITSARNVIAPESRDEKYEILFKFASHRWANVWCQLNHSLNWGAVIENGWPATEGSGQGRKAKCVKR